MGLASTLGTIGQGGAWLVAGDKCDAGHICFLGPSITGTKTDTSREASEASSMDSSDWIPWLSL